MHMNLGVPTPRAAHGMCTVNREIVIFGGRDIDKRTNDLHMFNVGMLIFFFCSSVSYMENGKCAIGHLQSIKSLPPIKVTVARELQSIKPRKAPHIVLFFFSLKRYRNTALKGENQSYGRLFFR